MNKLICDVCGHGIAAGTDSVGSMCFVCTPDGNCPGHYRLAEEPAKPNEKALTAERDAAQLALREHVAAVELANHVYMDEIKRLADEVSLHKAGHEGQARNTMAFYDDCEKLTKERDQLRAEVGRLQAIEAATKEWAEYYMPEDERREGSWQRTWLAQILAGCGPDGKAKP